jgi:ABC-type polysaccharide/polyol phosphate export permease
MWQLFQEIHENRELIWALALKDLRVRYKRSALGFIWALLNPLMTMVILTIVFSTIMRFSVNYYAIFLISALLPWTFFSQALSYSVDSVVMNAELLKKIRVAKSIFPLAALIANVINFLLSLLPLLLILAFLRFPFHWTWIYLPIPLISLFLFAAGCAFFFATANVFFRDVSHIVQIILSGWFYLSPVLYSIDFLPQKYRLLLRFNPMLYILNGFRMAIYYGQLPTLQNMAASLSLGAITLLLGYSVFRRFERSFVFYV